MPAVVRPQLDAPENWARLTRTTLDLNGSYVYTNRRVEKVEAQRVLSWPLLKQAPVEERVFAV